MKKLLTLTLLALSVGANAKITELSSIEGADTVRHLHFNDQTIVFGQTFVNLPELETVDFDGSIGHIDGYVFSNCPKLRRITFHGPICSTGGSQFVYNCPELEEVTFEKMIVGCGYGKPIECPRLDRYAVNGPVLFSSDSLYFPTTSIKEAVKTPEIKAQTAQMVDFIVAASEGADFLKGIAIGYFPAIEELCNQGGFTDLLSKLNPVKEVFGEALKPKLQILKESPAYDRSTAPDAKFTYAAPSDSMLTLSRVRFNLDSVAGQGTDVERIKNLTYWLHDLVRHDGSSTWPQCDFNLRDLYDVTVRDNRGLNCRFMAIMLTEALLAEGIPARYLTCQSKAFDTDGDCHVICMAWSRELGKWIWADPTFAAFVTDENGLCLHPGEVRYRLQNDLPLVLNDDTNWNHENTQTVDYYLKEYMAKNLYIISARLNNKANPEGTTNSTPSVGLTPIDSNFHYANILTTNDEWFWQAPYSSER